MLERPEFIATSDARLIARTLLAVLREIAEVVSITGALMVCRDPKDDVVIETAAEGRVDVLVSEDKDLTDDPSRFRTPGTARYERGARGLRRLVTEILRFSSGMSNGHGVARKRVERQNRRSLGRGPIRASPSRRSNAA